MTSPLSKLQQQRLNSISSVSTDGEENTIADCRAACVAVLPLILWHDLLLTLEKAFPKTVNLSTLRQLHTTLVNVFIADTTLDVHHAQAIPEDLQLDEIIATWKISGIINVESPTDSSVDPIDQRLFITTLGTSHLGDIQCLMKDSAAVSLMETAFIQTLMAKKANDDQAEEIKQLQSYFGDNYNADYVSHHINKHIERLHVYNTIKDNGQMVIGRIAAIENKTIKEVYKDLDLNLEE